MFNAGVRGKRSKDTTGIITVGEHFNQQNFLVPTVTRFAVTDGSYVDTNDAAADTAGSQTIVLYGSGFAPGATVLVGSTTIGAVTFLDSGRLAFSSPALGSGSYTIFVTNANGGTGILVPGLVYSGVPTFTTSAGSLGSVYETTAISTTVVATGDAPITYAISSGSLPTGSTLSSSGTISGTAPVDGSSTTYSFTVQATDADNQDSVRSFSLTINTDVVSFSSPANNTTTTVTQNSPISNVTPAATSAAGYGVLYTSSGLPTGLSMNTSTGIISGTPTVVASNTSIITATANTTSRTAALYLNWTINLPGDLFWKYASLLMSANSAPNGNTFNTDASTINNEIVVVADTKPNEFHPFKEGYYSNFFDGTGDYLAILTSSAFNIATNSFTVEAWINTSSATQQTIFNISDTASSGYGAVRVQVLADKTVQWLMGPGGSWGVAVTAGSIVLGAWNHIAITRNGSSVYFFVNGLQVGTTQTYATSLTTGGTTYIGYNSGTAYGFNGYISNLRFVNGTALYTANTTLSTAPLTYVANTSLLTCQSNRLIDNSNNNFTIVKGGDTRVNPFSPFNGTPTTVTVPGANNYSVYFDGTGDYLTTAATSVWANLWFGDVTVECWVYFNSVASTPHIWSFSESSSIRVTLYVDSSVFKLYTTVSTGSVIITSATTLTTGRWYHVAITKNSGTWTMWLNGVSQGTSTSTNRPYGVNEMLAVGTQNYSPGAGDYLNGYISNFRAVSNTAVYTSAFTPSTTPLTAIANTSLLTAQANTIIDNSSNALTITTNGNAGPARNGPFANTTTVTLIGNEGSAYFDGTGDLLTIPNHPSHAALGTSNFTLELWFNQTVLNARDNYLISHRVGGYAPFLFWINSSGSLRSYASTSLGSWDTMNDTALATISLNTWYHLAYTRSGSTFKIFLNGAQVHSFTSSATFTTATTALNIGGQVGGTDNFTGYVSNARFVKGTALYTSAFVPSFAPLTPVANTVLLTAQTNLSSNTKVIVDESNLNNIVSGFGNSNLGTFSPFGSSRSVYFDGTGDYLDVPSNAVFTLGTGDFTIEGWMYMNSVTTGTLYDSRTGVSSVSPVIYLTSGVLVYYVAGSNVITGPTLLTGQWYHIAVVRNSGSTKMYLNGTQTGSTYTDSNNYVIGGPKIGAGYSNVNLLTGYISNLRVVKGTAVYTANTTAPTTPLVSVANTVLLTCNSNQFVDYAAANNVITRNGDAVVSEFSPFSTVTVTPASYSGYFDGNGDYLSVPTNAAFSIGTGDYTVETWLYLTGSAANMTFFAGGVTGTPVFNIGLTRTTISINPYGSGPVNETQGCVQYFNFNLNTWYHVAITRASGTTKIFLNGTQLGTNVNDPYGYVQGAMGIGATQDNVQPFTGYISNLRYVKGTALYTSNFTPSTTPLTAVANTSLLACQSTTFVDTSNNAFAITVNGNAKPVIQNPFTDTVSTASNYSANTFGNSVYFDGTGDYASYTASLLIPGPFTAECWFYNTSTSGAQQTLFAFNSTSGAYASVRVDCDGSNASNQMQALLSTSGSAWTTNIGVTSAYVKGVWNHIAVTRDSSNLVRFFVNGVVIGTATQTGTLYNTSTIHGIGTASLPGAISGPFQGYISNLRMINGQALYTGPFIPSGQPLPVTSNTTLLLASTVGPSTADATRNHNIETFGTARQVANNSPYYDTYSAYFKGSSDLLSIPGNSAFAFGTGDFTVEFWLYNNVSWASQTNPGVVGQKQDDGTAGWQIYRNGGSNDMYVRIVNTNDYGSGVTPATQVWEHWALVRSGSNLTWYRNGTATYTHTGFSQNITDTAGLLYIGYTQTWGGYLNAIISNLRIVKGTAVYTSNFTPSTTPLTAIANTVLLTCQSNRFIDGSTNAFTITKAGDAKITAFVPFANSNNSRFNSVYFPTKTDYLGIRPQPNVITFPGDFTFECWVYPTDTTLSSTWGIWDSRQAGGTANPMIFFLTALASPVTGSWRLSYYNGTQYYGTGTVLWNQWTHVAWARSGTTMTFYVNGVAGGTATISGTQTGNATTAPIYIGSKDSGTSGYGTIGYIADLRVTNGDARTIILPTAPYDIK